MSRETLLSSGEKGKMVVCSAFPSFREISAFLDRIRAYEQNSPSRVSTIRPADNEIFFYQDASSCMCYRKFSFALKRGMKYNFLLQVLT